MTPTQLLTSLLLVFSATGFAQNNNPLDFGYEVVGPPQFRPSAVFNDGKDTFIQTRSDNDLDIKALSGVERRGIYLVVPGLPERVNFRLAAGESIEIRRLRSVKPNASPATSDKFDSAMRATEKTAPAKLPRIAFIGTKPELKSQVLASGEGVPLQLAYSGMKPESYSLVLDVPKDHDRRPTDWDLPREGMNWTEALELLAEASNTYVEINAGSKLVRVTATPALSHRKTAEAAGMVTPPQQKMRDVASTARLAVLTPTINPPVPTPSVATTAVTAAVPEKITQPQQLPGTTLAPPPTLPALSLPIATAAVPVPAAQNLPVAAPVAAITEEMRLQLEPNAMLHLVLEKFGKDNGTTIQWVHPDRIRISTARQIRGTSVRQVLEQTLNLFELTAVYDKGTNTYYVR